MSNSIKDKWEKRYQSSVTDTEDKYPSAVEVLRNNQHLLPESGSALDLACGLGANAICLAEHGLTTSAWDISASALEQLTNYSKKYNLHIITKERDVTPHPPVVNSFDVIVISRFLDRNLIPHIKNAIKPKGLIFYQTFTKEKVNQSGPSNPDFLLDKNELLNCFHDWQILFYREEGITGNIKLGFRNQAMLVAEKP
ncbi:MAG: class I SAM-dependent methyltransferase [Gammaproteobacteria bacterium]